MSLEMAVANFSVCEWAGA